MSLTILPDALYTGALWMLERERVLDAAHFFRALLIQSPTDERGWLGLGTCHEQLGQADEAKSLYVSGSIAAASGVKCMVALARLHRHDDQGELADSILEEAAAAAAGDTALEQLIQQEQECT
jgi:Flp pilus assembly protein TadD